MYRFLQQSFCHSIFLIFKQAPIVSWNILKKRRIMLQHKQLLSLTESFSHANEPASTPLKLSNPPERFFHKPWKITNWKRTLINLRFVSILSLQPCLNYFKNISLDFKSPTSSLLDWIQEQISWKKDFCRDFRNSNKRSSMQTCDANLCELNVSCNLLTIQIFGSRSMKIVLPIWHRLVDNI